LVRNWAPWRKLGVQRISAPNGYHTYAGLDFPVSLGDYQFPTDAPIFWVGEPLGVLRLQTRIPVRPPLPTSLSIKANGQCRTVSPAGT